MISDARILTNLWFQLIEFADLSNRWSSLQYVFDCTQSLGHPYRKPLQALNLSLGWLVAGGAVDHYQDETTNDMYSNKSMAFATE